jgi:PIN domain nuclease of toxin-antitoxin system
MGPEQRSPAAAEVRSLVSGGRSGICLSVVNAWEIAIKHQAGKLAFDVPLEDVLARILDGAVWPVLPVLPVHITELAALPAIHRDPFDRMLIAQARVERMTLATADALLAGYRLPMLRC